MCMHACMYVCMYVWGGRGEEEGQQQLQQQQQQQQHNFWEQHRESHTKQSKQILSRYSAANDDHDDIYWFEWGERDKEMFWSSLDGLISPLPWYLYEKEERKKETKKKKTKRAPYLPTYCIHVCMYVCIYHHVINPSLELCLYFFLSFLSVFFPTLNLCVCGDDGRTLTYHQQGKEALVSIIYDHLYFHFFLGLLGGWMMSVLACLHA